MYPENGKVPGLLFEYPAFRHSRESIKEGMQPSIESLSNIVEGLKALQDEDVPLRRNLKQRCESYRILVDDAGLSSENGFEEVTSTSVCTQYDAIDCGRF